MISKDKRVCSLSSTPLLKFEGLPSNEKVDSFSGFLTSFLLISSFFLISNLLLFFPLHSKYSIDFFFCIFFLLFFFVIFSYFPDPLLLVFLRNGKTIVVMPRVCQRRLLLILSSNLSRKMHFGSLCHFVSLNLSRDGSHEV